MYTSSVAFVYDPINFAMKAYWPYLSLHDCRVGALKVDTISTSIIKNRHRSTNTHVRLILFHPLVRQLFYRQSYPKSAVILSLMECIYSDDLRRKRNPDANFDFLYAVYHQPAMRKKMLPAKR